MDEHASIHDLLTLAAAGALDAADQRRVEQHLRECADCRAEFHAWGRLTGALEALPTPQAPSGLVERTRRLLDRQAAVQIEHRRSRMPLVWLTLLAWAGTLLTWPLFQLLGGFLEVSPLSSSQVWIAYLLVSWMTSMVIAGLLAQRHRQERTL
ncbi:MAG TPA: zf-HC2 domain-containing protein [Terriglobales bacterium]